MHKRDVMAKRGVSPRFESGNFLMSSDLTVLRGTSPYGQQKKYILGTSRHTVGSSFSLILVKNIKVRKDYKKSESIYCSVCTVKPKFFILSLCCMNYFFNEVTLA